MTKYLPRFKPEVYLRFLNKYEHVWDHDELEKYLKIYLEDEWQDNGTYMTRHQYVVSGKCLEECLDQAILATGFENELSSKKSTTFKDYLYNEPTPKQIESAKKLADNITDDIVKTILKE